MQSGPDLTCVDCNNEFKSAALLLQHFEEHAIKQYLEKETISIKADVTNKKSKIPNLYPISRKNKITINETDRGSDSGIEDINPLKFCLVTMEENAQAQENMRDTSTENKTNKSPIKKFQCTYCLKRFGWSTDLKRHTLIHTGERPFHCRHCDSSFTRNFLLQKHQRKLHISEISKMKLPELKPISELVNKKNRKQQKIKNNHKAGSSTKDCQSNYLKYELNRLLCSS